MDTVDLVVLVCLVIALVLSFLVAFHLTLPLAHAVQSLYYPETGHGYAFFSSIGYQIFGLPILACLYMRRNNCHARGCPWMGRFPAIEGNGWRYCRRHHTDNGVHL